MLSTWAAKRCGWVWCGAGTPRQRCTCSSSALERSTTAARGRGALPARARRPGRNRPKDWSTSLSSSACSKRPAAATTRLPGWYARRKKASSSRRSKRRTVARVPRIGRPSGWAGQSASWKRSMTRSSGVSSTMAISSNTTRFSLAISTGSKRGLSTMSPSSSTARDRCWSSTLRWKAAYSFEVKASMCPPIESTSAAICWAVRERVPLKTMCSTKWLMPDWRAVSWRLPRLSQTPTATLRTWSRDSDTRVRPLGRTRLRIMGRRG